MGSPLMYFSNRLHLGHIIPSYCLVSILVITSTRLIPASRTRFLSYGARASSVSSGPRTQARQQPDKTARYLDSLASLDVPHSWFMHFYLLSLSFSLFWLDQITRQGRFINSVSHFMPSQQSTIPAEVSWLCVLLMVFQSVRRLWESFVFFRSSTSRMWIGHYLFGITFYLAANVAVWIEGVGTVAHSDSFRLGWKVLLDRHYITMGLLLFMTASVLQFLAHAHLASLKKYTVPYHWLFQRLIAPHYTAECGIYLALSVIAAPDQYLFNRTILWIVLLTIVNLAITAADTKEWMIRKFPERRPGVEARYCMLPGIW